MFLTTSLSTIYLSIYNLSVIIQSLLFFLILILPLPIISCLILSLLYLYLDLYFQTFYFFSNQYNSFTIQQLCILSVCFMMQELIQDYDDMFTGLSSDILKNIFIRFYTMEEYFQFDQLQPPTLIKSQSSSAQNPPQSQKSAMQAQKSTRQEQTKLMVPTPPAAQPQKKPTPILLLYNRIIQESINDLYIMNKLIYSKAKVVNALLENGKSIAAKKKQSWDKFICTDGFEQIKAAFDLLCDYRKQIVIFSVLSISNLLLKLSINMSKVSVIPIQKFLNFQCLSIPTLSVAFLQNMQYRLFESKKISDDQGKVQFMRQLPKVTYIKLSKYKTNTDLKLLDISQREFISSQIPIEQIVKNLQYIQIHEQQFDPILPDFTRNQESYPHFYAFGLKQMSKGTVKAPFKFEILELMRQIVFPLVKDFKPDEIIYMENYPNHIQVMDDQIRALMICQLAQQTCCNKMYVFKELGPTKFCIPAYQNAIKESGQKISQQFANFFAEEQRKIANSYNAKKNASFQDQIKKIKKIFMNQLCYTSLALIQKTSFDSIRHQSYQNFYPIEFLQGISTTQSGFLQNPLTKIEAFKTKMEGVGMMIEVHKFHQQKNQNNNVGLGIINLSLKETCFKFFYNLNSSKEQELFSVNQNGEKQLFYYSEQDNMIVKYEEKRVVVIIIRYNGQHDYVQMVVLSLHNQQSVMQIQAKIILDPNENYLQGATYICSNSYLYRGFGRYKKMNENENNYNKCIHRIKISPQVNKFWQPVAEQAMETKPGQKQEPKVPLQRKVHGYGLFDPESKAILMMGGYIDSYNEEKICKNIYHIKFPDGSQIGKGEKGQKQMPQIVNVRVLGKTNKIVYTPTNQKIKQIFLYPFVYGIPFIFGSTGVASNPPPAKGAFVLNTNGYYLNLNNNNKIFMSVMKFSNIIMYNGINIQTKLKLESSLNDASTAIFLSEVLIKCAVFFPHQINIKGNRCCINTLEEGNIIIEANLGERKLIVQAPQIFEDDVRRQLNFK